MKMHFKLFLLLGLAFICIPLAYSQTDPLANLGALAFVNAVGTEEKTFITVNGTPVGKTGFDAGGTTLFLGYPKGPGTIVAKNGDLANKPLSLNIVGTASPIIIVYLKVETKGDKEVKVVQSVAVPNSTNKSGTEYRLVLVGTDKDQPVAVNGESVNLKPYRSQILKKGAISVTTPDGAEILHTSSGDPANFLVVIYPGANGHLAATSIFDELVVLEKPKS